MKAIKSCGIITRKYKSYFIKLEYKINDCTLTCKILQNSFPTFDFTAFIFDERLDLDAEVGLKDSCTYKSKNKLYKNLNKIMTSEITASEKTFIFQIKF